jgi:ATP-dependent DNA helicase RecG
LKFEELFFIQLKLLKAEGTSRKNVPRFCSFRKWATTSIHFYNNHLPFELTNAQKRVIKEVRLDMGSGKQMNRLLQGDVGSGKTLVALMNMLIALDNGFQACLMAPTEILANQHYRNHFGHYLKPLDIQVGLLDRLHEDKSTQRYCTQQLLSGEMQILIGTHALLEDDSAV